MSHAPMTDTDIQAALACAGRLAASAANAILPHFRAGGSIDNKAASGFDPVTEADRAAEKAMRDILQSERPDDGILGEEFDETPSQNGYKWVLDPVDGTRAFVAGLPVWTTLIALCDASGDPVIGVIDQPVLGERYVGWPGGAALETATGSTPMHVSSETDLRRATISTTDPFILTPAEQGAWTHLRATARLVRYGLDAYAYARLAAGSIDLVAESGLAPYDAAAVIAVVRGAGGLACDWSGAPAKPGGQLVCAASEGILDQALISLRRSAVNNPYRTAK